MPVTARFEIFPEHQLYCDSSHKQLPVQAQHLLVSSPGAWRHEDSLWTLCSSPLFRSEWVCVWLNLSSLPSILPAPPPPPLPLVKRNQKLSIKRLCSSHQSVMCLLLYQQVSCKLFTHGHLSPPPRPHTFSDLSRTDKSSIINKTSFTSRAKKRREKKGKNQKQMKCKMISSVSSRHRTTKH